MPDSALAATVVDALHLPAELRDIRVTAGGAFVARSAALGGGRGKWGRRSVRVVADENGFAMEETRSVRQSRRFMAEKLEEYLRDGAGNKLRLAERWLDGKSAGGGARPAALDLRHLRMFRRRHDAVLESLRALKDPAQGGQPVSGKELSHLAHRVVRVARLGRLPMPSTAPAVRRGEARHAALYDDVGYDGLRRQFYVRKGGVLQGSLKKLALHFKAGRQYYARRAARAFAQAVRHSAANGRTAYDAFLASGHRLEDLLTGSAASVDRSAVAAIATRADESALSRKAHKDLKVLVDAFAPGGGQWQALLHASGVDGAFLERHSDLLAMYLEEVALAKGGGGMSVKEGLHAAAGIAKALARGRKGDLAQARTLRKQCATATVDILVFAVAENLPAIGHTLERLHALRKNMAQSDPVFGLAAQGGRSDAQLGADDRRALDAMSLAYLRSVEPFRAHNAAMTLHGDFGQSWAAAQGMLDADFHARLNHESGVHGDDPQALERFHRRGMERALHLRDYKELLFDLERELGDRARQKTPLPWHGQELVNLYEAGYEMRRAMNPGRVLREPQAAANLLAAHADEELGLRGEDVGARLHELGGLWGGDAS